MSTLIHSTFRCIQFFFISSPFHRRLAMCRIRWCSIFHTQFLWLDHERSCEHQHCWQLNWAGLSMHRESLPSSSIRSSCAIKLSRSSNSHVVLDEGTNSPTFFMSAKFDIWSLMSCLEHIKSENWNYTLVGVNYKQKTIRLHTWMNWHWRLLRSVRQRHVYHRRRRHTCVLNRFKIGSGREIYIH